LSKIKIMETNKILVDEASRVFDKILSMQSEAESQIRDIKTIEKKILDIQKKRQIEETLLAEKIAMQKLMDIHKAEEHIEIVQKVIPAEKPAAEKAAKTEKIPEKAAEMVKEKHEEKPSAAAEIDQKKAETPAAVIAEDKKPEKTVPEKITEQKETASAQKPAVETQIQNEKTIQTHESRQNIQERQSAGREKSAQAAERSGERGGFRQRQENPYREGERPQYNREGGAQRQDRPPYNREGGAQRQDRPPYNREGGGYQQRQDRPPYNREGGYQQRQDRPPYNREGGGYQQRQDRPPYNREGGYQQRQDRPPYNREGGYQQRQDRPFNRDGAPRTDRPPFTREGYGARPPFMNKDKDEAEHPQRKPQQKSKSDSGEFSAIEKPKTSSYDSKKFKKPAVEDSKTKTVKKTGIKEHVILDGDEDDFPRGSRKRRRKQPPAKVIFEPIVIEKAVITSDTLSVKLFAEKIGKPVSDILKKLLLLGMMCTINSQIDFDTASLIAAEFGIELEQKLEQTAEEVLTSADDEVDDPKDLIKRPPIVTIMGHVDHGKTSLLDKIRSTKVTESEAGGITQHIGAYQIEVNGNPITFIDTPGHEAFTAMRARGAQVTDVAILVVAADDGVMPQTIEAINHSKAAKVPIIVAINKIDKAGANIDKIKQSLTEYELVAEEWGGDTVMVPVSAVTGQGIDQLLDMILLVSDVQELRANPKRMAKGTIVEAKLDKGRGPVATVLIQNGTLHVGDPIVAGMAIGRVRAMVDDNGNSVLEAGPSKPVEVIGFSDVPEAGDIMYAVEQDKLSKQVVEERRDKQKADMLKKMTKVSLDDLFTQIAEGQIKDLNIIIKADVQGSVEAVKQSLEKLSNEEVRVKAIHCGVGAIKETDVMLASTANAIIIGFNVRPETKAKVAAEHEKVDIRLYRVIYKAIEDITNAMKGMLEPEFEEVILGHVEVRQIFKVSNVGTIAGCYVTDGKITRNSQARLLRDNIVVHEGKISSLKRFKDDAKEVAQGYECGVSLENYNDIKEGDVFESFVVREKER
jgi:translation initiation factor IF-2